MAIYTLPESANRIAGSRKGSTFQKCGKSFAIRKRNVPTNKSRLKQSASKNKLAATSSQYKTLDSTEQQSFIDNSPSFPRTNSLGESYTLSGLNLQNSSNVNLINAALPTISEMQPPVSFPVAVPSLCQVVPDTELAQFQLSSPNPVPTGFSLQVFLCRPISQGVIPNQSDFVLGYTLAAGQSTTGNRWAVWSGLFGNGSNQVGQAVWAMFVYVSTVNGQRSTPVFGVGSIVD